MTMINDGVVVHAMRLPHEGEMGVKTPWGSIHIRKEVLHERFVRLHGKPTLRLPWRTRDGVSLSVAIPIDIESSLNARLNDGDDAADEATYRNTLETIVSTLTDDLTQLKSALSEVEGL